MEYSEISTTQTPKQVTGGLAFPLLMLGLFLTLLLEALDQTIVGTAMPKIIAYLNGFEHYSWVITAYLLTSTTLIPIAASLSDQFGRKWFLVTGTILFIVGSILSGLSQTMTQLILFRGVQGLGAGIGIALVFATISDVVPPADRPKWQSLFGAVYGFANLLGPTLGGWLTEHAPTMGSIVTDSTRWRWIFYINLPVGIVALTLSTLYLPARLYSHQHFSIVKLKRIDILGSLLAASATVCLLLGLSWGGNKIYEWSSPQVIMILIASSILFVGFIIAERFAIEPILPLSMFRNRVFTASSFVGFTTGMILLGLMIYLPLFLQGVLGENATISGTLLTPLTVSSVIGAAVSGMVIQAIKRYQVVAIVATLIMSVGVFLLTRLNSSSSFGAVIPCMVITGIGLGAFFSIPIVATQNAVERARLGVATGALRYVSAIGQLTGTAIIGAVVNRSLSEELAPRLKAVPNISSVPPAVVDAATNPQILLNADARSGLVQGVLTNVPLGFQDATRQTLNMIFDATKSSLSVAIVQGFVVAFILCGVTLLGTFLLKDIPWNTLSDNPETYTDEIPEQNPPSIAIGDLQEAHK
jgi:EmrB/QacA subfamily drug resistance transporter